MLESVTKDDESNLKRIIALLRPSMDLERKIEDARKLAEFPHLLDSFMARIEKIADGKDDTVSDPASPLRPSRDLEDPPHPIT